MSNSPLISCTKISPNKNSPRNKPIDRITIHCVVGQCTAERIGEIFQNKDRQASCNYGIGKDGRIILVVDEKDRSWCSSSGANDHRAIAFEVASDTTHPYAVTDAALQSAINLCEDICRRYGKKKLLWFGDKDKTLAYKPKADEMVMTVHRWFAAKACPGDYLYNRHGMIAEEVTKRLSGAAPSTPTSSTPAAGGKETAVNYAVRVTATDLNIRSGPGTGNASKGYVAPGIYTIVAEADGAGASKWGKLKSGKGWISLDFAKKTGAASSAKTVTVGAKVTIADGAVYGGLTAARGAKVPAYVSGTGRRYTVKKLEAHKGTSEALLTEINSWVAVSYLTVV